MYRVSGPEKNIVTPLRKFSDAVKNLPESDIKDFLSQYIRIFILVIDNRLENLAAPMQGTVKNLIETLKKDFGNVPELNEIVSLPNNNFLPPDMLIDEKRNTLDRWKKTIWTAPEKESLEFFDKKEVDSNGKMRSISSVRRHLINLDNHNTDHGYALCYAICAFEKVGNLHADHLQPASKILQRQLELILALNYDPKFFEKTITLPYADGFFKRTSDGKIYGTKYFYMLYHNCIDNTWLISAAENSGLGKGGQDPIIWLQNNEKFREYFNGRSVDKSKILYCVNDKILAASVREWFILRYKNSVGGAEMINRFKEKLRVDLPVIIESRRARIDTVVMFALFGTVMDFLSKRSEKRIAKSEESKRKENDTKEGRGLKRKASEDVSGSSDVPSLDLHDDHQKEAAIALAKSALTAPQNKELIEDLLNQGALSIRQNSKSFKKA